MLKQKTILAIIPARGGSKGLKRKNILPLAGKPLLTWSIEAAKKSKYLDRIVLSSEDPEIIKVAKEAGLEVPFVRPFELALDNSLGLDPVLHCLQTLPEKYDYVLLLQPTSPLRLASDIDQSLELCLEHKAPACVSVTLIKHNPYWCFTLNPQGCLDFFQKDNFVTNRQSLPEVYHPNGAVYIAETKWLMQNKSFYSPQTIAYIMPKERSVDIDDELDFKMAECILDYKKS